MLDNLKVLTIVAIFVLASAVDPLLTSFGL